jgi:hypothetical protein
VSNQVDTRFISAGADVHSCQLLGIPSVELALAQKFEHDTRCHFVLPKRLRISTQISVKMYDKVGTLLHTSEPAQIYPVPVIVGATPPFIVGSEATSLELQVRFGDILHSKHELLLDGQRVWALPGEKNAQVTFPAFWFHCAEPCV